MAASWSGSSQMWNWKSGVSLRSSTRMASQISYGCVGTGGRDPPQGLAEEPFTEEGRAGEKWPLPSARRVYNGPNRSEPPAPGRLRKTRKKHRRRHRPRCRQEVHGRMAGDLV